MDIFGFVCKKYLQFLFSIGGGEPVSWSKAKSIWLVVQWVTISFTSCCFLKCRLVFRVRSLIVKVDGWLVGGIFLFFDLIFLCTAVVGYISESIAV